MSDLKKVKEGVSEPVKEGGNVDVKGDKVVVTDTPFS